MTNKVKRIELNDNFLFQLLAKGGKVFIYNELPDGCKLLKIYHDDQTYKTVFIITHESFEEIDEGAIVPEFDGEIYAKELPDEEVKEEKK